LLLPLALGTWTWNFVGRSTLREAFVKAVVLCAAACVAITEALSVFNSVTMPAVAASWIAVALAGLVLRPPERRTIDLRFHPLWLAVATIVALVAWTALASAPNSADAMAYHLPRVIYWRQQHSVNFFPTSYFNQISLQPFAEYIMLHTYLLSGGDRFVNLV